MNTVVGVGASAGGLEAMLPMFASLSDRCQPPYVVAQHMAKHGHDELMVRLMQRESTLPVCLASHGMPLQADRVHVIPSGRNGEVRDGALWLSEPLPQQLSTPSVDHLFSSIARSCRHRGIGIVLSGTGQDGRVGCRAIQAAGGLTLAQSPQEARFDGMPLAAIEGKAVDRVLMVGEMGQAVVTRCVADSSEPLTERGGPSTPTADLPAPSRGTWESVQLPAVGALYSAGALGGDASPTAADVPVLGHVVRRVRLTTGLDFGAYKEDTLLRRMVKRRTQLGLYSAAQYQAYVEQHPAELTVLQRLFLVSVSWFYRDSASFSALQRAWALMTDPASTHAPWRVWVPGCASGEEVYTLAMMARELRPGVDCPALVLGTDLNPSAIEQACAGRYRIQALREMAPLLRQSHLTVAGDGFEVRPELRVGVQFTCADVQLDELDPGWGGDAALDLISCRNLFIYLNVSLQDRLLQRFHRRLKPGGLLFIGQSETLSAAGHTLFEPVDVYHRVFRRRA